MMPNYDPIYNTRNRFELGISAPLTDAQIGALKAKILSFTDERGIKVQQIDAIEMTVAWIALTLTFDLRGNANRWQRADIIRWKEALTIFASDAAPASRVQVATISTPLISDVDLGTTTKDILVGAARETGQDIAGGIKAGADVALAGLKPLLPILVIGGILVVGALFLMKRATA